MIYFKFCFLERKEKKKDMAACEQEGWWELENDTVLPGAGSWAWLSASPGTAVHADPAPLLCSHRHLQPCLRPGVWGALCAVVADSVAVCAVGRAFYKSKWKL